MGRTPPPLEPDAVVLRKREPEHALDRSRSGPGTRSLIELWLDGRSVPTVLAYKDDLRDFAAFLKVGSADDAVAVLLSKRQGQANALALAYRHSMVARDLAPATVNRRLAALRSLVKLANSLEVVPWLLGIGNVKSEQYRDTAGPGVEKIEKLLDSLLGTPNAVRNRAMVLLLFNLALRRGEVVELRVEHVDFEERRLSILGKGHTERQWVTLETDVAAALEAWLAERGPEPGSLFNITGHGLWNMVRASAERAGIGVARPHGLRHSAITNALDNGDTFREVARFSRHKNLNTLTRYDDNRQDIFGEVAERNARKRAAARAERKKKEEP